MSNINPIICVDNKTGKIYDVPIDCNRPRWEHIYESYHDLAKNRVISADTDNVAHVATAIVTGITKCFSHFVPAPNFSVGNECFVNAEELKEWLLGEDVWRGADAVGKRSDKLVVRKMYNWNGVVIIDRNNGSKYATLWENNNVIDGYIEDSDSVHFWRLEKCVVTTADDTKATETKNYKKQPGLDKKQTQDGIRRHQISDVLFNIINDTAIEQELHAELTSGAQDPREPKVAKSNFSTAHNIPGIPDPRPGKNNAINKVGAADIKLYDAVTGELISGADEKNADRLINFAIGVFSKGALSIGAGYSGMGDSIHVGGDPDRRGNAIPKTYPGPGQRDPMAWATTAVKRYNN